MKKRILTICTAAILFAACNNEKTDGTQSGDSKKPDSTSAMKNDDKKTGDTYTMPDSTTAMKNWKEYATPGEMQKMLAGWNGVWDAEDSMWEMPGSSEMKATGTMTNKMIMDGRYQQSSFKSMMMGMQMEGESTVAFDNHKKSFISTWIDNMGTGLAIFEGAWDPATRSVDFKGKMVDPQVGKELNMREVFKVIDDNHQIMEMYKPAPDGKEFLNMRISYTRKKK